LVEVESPMMLFGLFISPQVHVPAHCDIDMDT